MSIQDPEDLARAEREIRINELKVRARELAGEEMTVFESPEASPEMLEAFWQSIVEMEGGQWTTGHEQLEEDGLRLPDPTTLSDMAVSAKLAEVIDALANRHTYLCNTNHLSDRDLYACLWSEALHESFPTFPALDGLGGYIIDMVGSGTEQDVGLYLRYYASDSDRRDWLRAWPGFEMPPQEVPPFDRDRHLPKPPDEDPIDEAEPPQHPGVHDDIGPG